MTDPTTQADTGALGFQGRVKPWFYACFPPEVCIDIRERCDRFVEEAFELVQSLGYEPDRIATLRDYVWGRPVGEPSQEVGGVMVTLAALCDVAGLDMHDAGETELARILQPEVVEKIRAKQASKRGLHTPLPTGPARTTSTPPIAAGADAGLSGEISDAIETLTVECDARDSDGGYNPAVTKAIRTLIAARSTASPAQVGALRGLKALKSAIEISGSTCSYPVVSEQIDSESHALLAAGFRYTPPPNPPQLERPHPLEIAYGALWRHTTDNAQIHAARRFVLAAIGGPRSDGQRRGVEWACTNIPPDEGDAWLLDEAALPPPLAKPNAEPPAVADAAEVEEPARVSALLDAFANCPTYDGEVERLREFRDAVLLAADADDAEALHVPDVVVAIINERQFLASPTASRQGDEG